MSIDSTDLGSRFEAAVSQSKLLPSQSNDNLLDLYSLYKQATAGDISGKKPGRLDIKGRAKYDAWEKRRGMSKDAAMRAYIELVDRLGG